MISTTCTSRSKSDRQKMPVIQLNAARVNICMLKRLDGRLLSYESQLQVSSLGEISRGEYRMNLVDPSKTRGEARKERKREQKKTKRKLKETRGVYFHLPSPSPTERDDPFRPLFFPRSRQNAPGIKKKKKDPKRASARTRGGYCDEIIIFRVIQKS
jgi:hypothetical protein